MLPPLKGTTSQDTRHHERQDITALRHHILDRFLRIRRQDHLQESRIEHAIVMRQREYIDKKEQTAERRNEIAPPPRQERAEHRQQQRKPRHAQHPFQEQQRHPFRRQRLSFIQIELDQMRHIRQAKPAKEPLRKMSP